MQVKRWPDLRTPTPNYRAKVYEDRSVLSLAKSAGYEQKSSHREGAADLAYHPSVAGAASQGLTRTEGRNQDETRTEK